jgi:hypothetical protein
MLRLARRHHTTIPPAEAYPTSRPTKAAATGPEILSFKRLKNGWKTINQTDFKAAASDASTLN